MHCFHRGVNAIVFKNRKEHPCVRQTSTNWGKKSHSQGKHLYFQHLGGKGKCVSISDQPDPHSRTTMRDKILDS